VQEYRGEIKNRYQNRPPTVARIVLEAEGAKVVVVFAVAVLRSRVPDSFADFVSLP
jgi:hypothetical protein